MSLITHSKTIMTFSLVILILNMFFNIFTYTGMINALAIFGFLIGLTYEMSADLHQYYGENIIYLMGYIWVFGILLIMPNLFENPEAIFAGIRDKLPI